jgi:hypothetical protein
VFTLREERRLKVFNNRVLKRTFGTKRDEVTGVRRRLHNEELCNLYSSPNTIRVIKENEMSGTSNVYGERGGVCRDLVCKTEGKRPQA